LQSVTGQQGVAYRHIILLAIEVSEEVANQIAKNCRRQVAIRMQNSHP